MSQAKYALAGTIDQVKAQFDALQRFGGAGDLEWFGWFFDQGFMPWEEEMRQMELFVEHIIPAFRRAGRRPPYSRQDRSASCAAR
jgi:hypothetical protein